MLPARYPFDGVRCVVCVIRAIFPRALINPNPNTNRYNVALRLTGRFADPVLRGVTEDYYFNETLDFYTWTNTEHR